MTVTLINDYPVSVIWQRLEPLTIRDGHFGVFCSRQSPDFPGFRRLKGTDVHGDFSSGVARALNIAILENFTVMEKRLGAYIPTLTNL